MSGVPPTYSDSDLLTIREVARLLKLKPDTLYRWARSDRLPATKVGKEWRVAVSDVEKVVGRSLPRAPLPTYEEISSVVESEFEAEADGRHRGELEEGYTERRLRSFLRPRDSVVVLATKKDELQAVERIFWRTALAAGGPLLVPVEPGRLKQTRKAFAEMGYDTRALRRDGRLNLLEVEGLEQARRAIRIEAGKAGSVWATFGLSDSFAVPKQLAFDHARELDATCITSNAIVLSGWLVSKKDWSLTDLWRLESSHRGAVRAYAGESVFTRYS